MSARSCSSGRPSSSARDAQRVPGGEAGPAGPGELLAEAPEHPGVADVGGGLHRLPGAGSAVAFEGDEVDVGAEGAGELGAGLLGVVAGVVVGQKEHHRGQGEGDDGDTTGAARRQGDEQDGQQGRDEQPEQGVHELLAVEAGDRDPQDRQLLDGVRPTPRRAASCIPHSPSRSVVSRRGGGRGAGAASGVGVGESRFRASPRSGSAGMRRRTIRATPRPTRAPAAMRAAARWGSAGRLLRGGADEPGEGSARWPSASSRPAWRRTGSAGRRG